MDIKAQLGSIEITNSTCLDSPETRTPFDMPFHDEQAHVESGEDTVVFRIPVDWGHDMRKTVPLRMERDLRKIDFTGISRTAEQAEELLPNGQ